MEDNYDPNITLDEAQKEIQAALDELDQSNKDELEKEADRIIDSAK